MGMRLTRTALVIALVAVSAIATGCSSGGTSSSQSGSTTANSGSTTKPAFLVTYPGIDPAEANIKQGAFQAAKALNVTVVFRTATTEGDVAQQLNVTESSLTYPNLKGVSVVAADPNSQEGAMKLAKSKGMALSQGAGCATNTTAPICFDTHPLTLGEDAAKYLAPLMHGSGTVVIAQGTLGDVNNRNRQIGFQDYMKAHYPNIHVVQVLYSCDEPDTSVTCAEDAVAAHPNMTAYYANGDGVAAAAPTVFAKAGKHIIIASLDNLPSTLADIKAGSVAFTLVQPQVCMGYLLVWSNYVQAIKHEVSTVRYVDLGSTYVDKANIGTLNADEAATCAQLQSYFANTVFKQG
jgi:ABC-type sugar transport system substrate-binding protein